MTEEKLVKYLVDHGVYSHKALSGLKELVNEAIQECMDAAYENVVDIPIIHEMRNLKVK